jgi:hypothetical protein
VSRYDDLQSQSRPLHRKVLTAELIPALATIVCGDYLAWGLVSTPLLFVASLFAFFGAVFLYRALWRSSSSWYRDVSGQLEKVTAEMANLDRAMRQIYDRYPRRRKGEQFKRAYDLSGRTVEEFEEALAVGMKHEQKEVFVTAFVNGGKVVRVTASIGSPFRCSNADNPRLWKDHIDRLECDSLLQYHNHSVSNNSTVPSLQDYTTHKRIGEELGRHAGRLKSLIVYWNRINEWRVMEYDADRCWLSHEFDVAQSASGLCPETDKGNSRELDPEISSRVTRVPRPNGGNKKQAISTGPSGREGAFCQPIPSKISSSSVASNSPSSSPARRNEPQTSIAFPGPTVTEIFLKSSHIVSAGYNSSTATLFLRFPGHRTYKYFDVPSDVFDAFMKAPSHGKFANKHIYGSYRQQCL